MFSPVHLLSSLPTWPHRLHTSRAGLVGTVAAVLTTISLVPQLLRVWDRQSAKDVSLGMFLLFSVGVLLWFLYGVMIHSVPVEVANGASFVFALAILSLKLHFDRKERRAARQDKDPS